MATGEGAGWKAAPVDEIPPVKADWPKTWKSVRHHFGITAFGINAVTKDAGNVLIPEHDEGERGQQEVFFVHEGEVKATVAGEEFTAPAGTFVAVLEPTARRKFESLASPTTLVVIGSPVGQAYTPPDWDRP